MSAASSVPILASLEFFAASALILFIILVLNRQEGHKKVDGKPGGAVATPKGGAAPGGTLPASDILAWEFEYARVTASEAMQDRLTMVNFYLLAAGVTASGVVFALGGSSRLPGFLDTSLGTALLWLLCCVGWIHFLKIIRLRQAWHDSAKTMNRIKEFYIEHAAGIAPDVLITAFRWQPGTLPAPGKPWTLFFYSAMLIGFLDSAAYVSGGVLLAPKEVVGAPLLGGALLLLGLIYFCLHIGLYFAFLPPEP